MKRLFVVLFLIGGTLSLFAQNKATFLSLEGKVEVLKNNEWLPAKVGMVVDTGVTISTGFRSKAKLDLTDSTLEVYELTRMTIETLAKEQGKAKTAVYLNVGKVKADVKSSSELKHDFTFRSPVATASVRGTSFTFTGTMLIVHEGSVQYVNSYGQRALVIVGQKVQITQDSGIRVKETTVGGYKNQDTIQEDSQEDFDHSDITDIETNNTGSISVTVTYPE